MLLTHLSIVLVWLFVLPAKSFTITGAGNGDNLTSSTLPSRHEISDFASSGPQFDLFLLSLMDLQNRNQSDLLSYFQIAGIHGYPMVSWDGVLGTGSYPGYCMHASVLFPIWHRPYLALMEQALWTTAFEIAGQYPSPQRDIYLNAARTLRIPYWDWATRPSLPTAVMLPTVLINSPTGMRIIPNPLYQYAFHPGQEGNGIPSGHLLSNMVTTVRYFNSSSGQSDNELANKVLLANAPSTLALTYQMLTSTTNYTLVSCTWPGGQFNGAFNIENVHNNIHNYVGGYNGHMSWPEIAAFDPVFWLHHANVDRLLALWQAVNPQSYVAPTVNAYGSYYEAAGTMDSSNTNLAPFHSFNNQTMFTPNDVWNISTFGYSYPELSDRGLSSGDVASHVKSVINQMYASPQGTSSDRSMKLSRSSEIEQVFGHVTFHVAKSLNINDCEVQWSIEITMEATGPHSSYNIDFFMGKLPNIIQSSTAPNLIATYGQFVVAHASRRTPFSNSNHGGISITHVLRAAVERGFLQDLSAASVVPVLRDHLIWRARSDDGCEVDLRSLSRLHITVQSRGVQPRKALNEFPIYGPYKTHFEATTGKVGGAQ